MAADNTLRFLEPRMAVVAGEFCEGMTVRSAAGILGQLQGLVVDPLARRLRYLVVKTSGLFGGAQLLEISSARIDHQAHQIELLDDDAVSRSQPFQRELFPAYSDDDLLAALFGRQPAVER
jgi:hypothetical protein